MTVGEGIPSWEASQAQVCDRIRSTHATLKILLKTKNERDFLGKWIEHHAAIVGLEGLIIFDNDSSDSSVLATLDSIRDQAVVTRFSGFHNDFHRIALFGALYQAVQSSCDYFIVLDTDEFLVWIDQGGEPVAASKIVDCLRALPRQELILGAWTVNRPGLENRFHLFGEGKPYPAGLASGKSIVSSAVDLSGTICHNWQLKGPTTKNVQYGNVLVLHMKALIPEQRINANMAKLRQYRFLSAEDGVDKVLQTNLKDMAPSNIRRYIQEIKRLTAIGKHDEKALPLGRGEIELDDSGRLKFHSADDKASLLAYLQNPETALREAFADRAVAQALLQEKKKAWKAARKKQDVPEATSAQTEITIQPLLPNPETVTPKVLPGRASAQRLLQEKKKAWRAKRKQRALEADSDQAKITVRPLPHMPRAAIECLRENLSASRCFLEFGSGGSTRMAVRMKVPHVYTVESDPAFARAVEHQIGKDAGETNFRMVSVDVGDTANNWGKPRNNDRCQNWPKYPTHVWSVLKKAGQTPDLILIDGRFRVACFLACLIQAEAGTVILFDDYAGREKQYKGVEKHLEPGELVGRMAVFKIPPIVDRGAVAFDLARYVVDPR
ncbi:MAG: glycosyltransferase family 2 protein [Panacagrimonas sp.]